MDFGCVSVIDHYLKIFGEIVNEVVVISLRSIFRKLMKVVFKNIYLIVALQITKFFFLFTKNLYLLYIF